MNSIKQNANLICKWLHENNFSAYIVGGAVRDRIRCMQPKDYDIATNASPDQVKRIFNAFPSVDVGEAFGITIIIADGVPFEIAQFRRDIGIGDSRHPSKIETTDDILIDLSRRDFTCNAIAFDPINKIFIDPFFGKEDIIQKIIRLVGNPSQRIEEDNLRILRAFRFAATLGFTIEKKSLEAIIDFFKKGGSFNNISQERITSEFNRLLIGKNAFEVIKLLFETKIIYSIIPELKELDTPHNSFFHTEIMEPFGNTILAHTLFVLKFACERSNKLEIRLAALLHDIGKNRCRENRGDHDRFLGHDLESAKMTENILKRMKNSSDIVVNTASLVKHHMALHDITKMKKVHKIRLLLGRKNIDDLLILGIADTLGTAGNNRVPNYEAAKQLQEIINKYKNQFPEMLPQQIITGNDLIEAGQHPGKEFSGALQVAYNLQLNGELNKRKLLNQAISFINTSKSKD
jgi:putative nucleotidyltransferase with HDIG domain